MYGTYAGIQLGLIAEPIEGGDSTFAHLLAVDANQADMYFGTEVNKTKLLNALPLAIATKACWWNTNHHLGGERNKLGGYLQKVFANKYTATGANLAKVTDAIYKLGHFYDTRCVLAAADVDNIVAPPAYFKPNVRVKLSNDCILGFKSMPAGTHRLAVACEAPEKIARQ